jgi:hypothetical protein
VSQLGLNKKGIEKRSVITVCALLPRCMLYYKAFPDATPQLLSLYNDRKNACQDSGLNPTITSIHVRRISFDLPVDSSSISSLK